MMTSMIFVRSFGAYDVLLDLAEDQAVRAQLVAHDGRQVRAVLRGAVDADRGVEGERDLDEPHEDDHEDGDDERELGQRLPGAPSVLFLPVVPCART